MAHSNASKAQIVEIVNQLGNGRINAKLAQALIEGRVIIKSADLITVPNLSVAELCQLAQEKLGLTYLNPDLVKGRFVTDEAGRTYERMVWTPGCRVTTDEVRKHFPKGFVGNTAAFIVWVTANDPEGWHVSIPEDARLFPDGDDLCAPYFFRDDDARDLRLFDVRRGWGDRWSFVAFREVST